MFQSGPAGVWVIVSQVGCGGRVPQVAVVAQFDLKPLNCFEAFRLPAEYILERGAPWRKACRIDEQRQYALSRLINPVSPDEIREAWRKCTEFRRVLGIDRRKTRLPTVKPELPSPPTRQIGTACRGGFPSLRQFYQTDSTVPRPFDECCINPALNECRMCEDFLTEGDRRFDPLDHELVERPPHAGERFFTCRTMHNQLADQRIVIGADRITLVNMRIETHARAARHAQLRDFPRAAAEVVFGIFGIDSQLDRRPVAGNQFVLCESEFFARGDANLPLDQVNPGDHLADRVLHLDPRVDLDEIETCRPDRR